VSRPLPGAANDLTAAPDLGHPPRVGRLWAGSAGRLGLSRCRDHIRTPSKREPADLPAAYRPGPAGHRYGRPEAAELTGVAFTVDKRDRRTASRRGEQPPLMPRSLPPGEPARPQQPPSAASRLAGLPDPIRAEDPATQTNPAFDIGSSCLNPDPSSRPGRFPLQTPSQAIWSLGPMREVWILPVKCRSFSWNSAALPRNPR
jgi:hypothetical protein